MRLSEAIRLGAMLHPQAKRSFLGGAPMPLNKDTVRATCAMGAAWFASGARSHEEVLSETLWTPRGYAPAGWRITILDYPAEWRATMDARCVCPVPGCPGSGSIVGAIQHLNDDHDWTRERIADWVATVEPPEAADAVREETDRPVVTIRV